MARYTVRYAGRAPRDPLRDVKGVNVVVERDGEYEQYGAAVVDGLTLAAEYGEKRTGDPAFWSDVARAAVPLFEAAVRRGDIPTDRRTDAYEVRPRHVPPSGGPLADGDVVGGFDA